MHEWKISFANTSQRFFMGYGNSSNRLFPMPRHGGYRVPFQKYMGAVVLFYVLRYMYMAQTLLFADVYFVPEDDLTRHGHEGAEKYPKIEGPVTVIILAYQRSGSSFFGQIFNQNPSAFFTFEPLDGLYSAMYGTVGGYNTPSDIFYTWEGQPRVLPDFEVRSSAVVLQNLLSCRHEALPAEILVHPFWYGFKRDHKVLFNFTKCLYDQVPNMSKCRSGVSQICRVWFGQLGSNQDQCKRDLWQNTSALPNSKRFRSYQMCMETLRKKASKCFPTLNETCVHADIRATKVVRLSMNATQYLLKDNPESTKVIHLIRDPKAMAQSRMKYESVRGHWAGKDKVKEAKIICHVMLQDLKVRTLLEAKYPKAFHQVIYDDFIKDPTKHIKDIYSFIGKTPPVYVFDHFKEKTSINNTSSIQGVTASEGEQIYHICRTVYSYLNYTWPKVELSDIPSPERKVAFKPKTKTTASRSR